MMMIKTIKIKLALLSLLLLLTGGAAFAPPSFSSEPFLGEIMMVGFNFAPRGWTFCDGQLLPINQNQALYSLLGTVYGGDGRVTFAVPDLRGRMAMHRGNGYIQGARGGTETVTLTTAQIPAHRHVLKAQDDEGDTYRPGNNALAYDQGDEQYSTSAPDVGMTSASIASAGGGQAHENMPPFLVVNHCIALQGLFPNRN
jgi:microcystin-dependent protein